MRLAIVLLGALVASCTQQACPVAPAPKPAVAPPQSQQSIIWPKKPVDAVKSPVSEAPKPVIKAKPKPAKKSQPKPKARKQAIPSWCGLVPSWATADQIVSGATSRGKTVTPAQAQACVASKKA
jgi:hypothetical protein